MSDIRPFFIKHAKVDETGHRISQALEKRRIREMEWEARGKGYDEQPWKLEVECVGVLGWVLRRMEVCRESKVTTIFI